MSECTAGYPVTDGSLRSMTKPGLLTCCLDTGHAGPHYDENDNVSWQAGPPISRKAGPTDAK
jgi:hypothetical protein